MALLRIYMKIQISAYFPSFVGTWEKPNWTSERKGKVVHSGITDAERGTSFIMSQSDKRGWYEQCLSRTFMISFWTFNSRTFWCVLCRLSLCCALKGWPRPCTTILHSCFESGLDFRDNGWALITSGGPRACPAQCTFRLASQKAQKYVYKQFYSLWKGDRELLTVRTSWEPAKVKWCCFLFFRWGYYWWILFSSLCFSVFSHFLKQ